MKYGDKNGILILGIKRGDEINIEYSKKNIIDRINSYFGYKLINEVIIQTSNFKLKKKNSVNSNNFPENFQKKINKIKNDSIKNSLSQLLKAIKNV